MRSAASFDTICVGVWYLRIEAVFDQEMLLHSVDLDLQGAFGGWVADRERCRERTTGANAVLLDRAQCGARSAAHIVGPRLQAIEFLDHRERDDDIATTEPIEAAGIADQDRGVEHDSSTCTRFVPCSVTSFRRIVLGTGGHEVGQRHSSRRVGEYGYFRNEHVVAQRCGRVVDGTNCSHLPHGTCCKRNNKDACNWCAKQVRYACVTRSYENTTRYPEVSRE
jgi:hypothetical protein